MYALYVMSSIIYLILFIYKQSHDALSRCLRKHKSFLQSSSPSRPSTERSTSPYCLHTRWALIGQPANLCTGSASDAGTGVSVIFAVGVRWIHSINWNNLTRIQKLLRILGSKHAVALQVSNEWIILFLSLIKGNSTVSLHVSTVVAVSLYWFRIALGC